MFSLPSLLAFLQSGLYAGLAPSSLSGQVSAFSVLVQRPLTTKSHVKTFQQEVAHTVPVHNSLVPL